MRLTQRADLLLEGVRVRPEPIPFHLSGETEIALTFKNLGPTRASNVKTKADLQMTGIEKKKVAGPPMPLSVVGAGDTHTVCFPPLEMEFEDAVISSASRGEPHPPHLRLAFVIELDGLEVGPGVPAGRHGPV